MSKISSFPHVMHMELTVEMFIFFFSYQVSRIQCVFCTHSTSEFRLATSQGLTVPMWPVATTLTQVQP